MFRKPVILSLLRHDADARSAATALFDLTREVHTPLRDEAAMFVEAFRAHLEQSS